MTENLHRTPDNPISPTVRQMASQQKVSGRRALGDWLKILRELSAIDETGERSTKQIAKRGWVLSLLMIPLAIAGYIFSIIAELHVPGPLFFLAASIVPIYYFIRWRGSKKRDLTNDFRLTLLPFLQTLVEDAAPKGKIKLELDLSGPTKAKLVKKSKLPPGNFRSIVERIYTDPWCRVEVPLFGGRQLLLSIENRFTELTRSRKNSRGKIKTKTKWKKLVRVSVGLLYNPEELSFITGPGKKEKKIRVVTKPSGQVVSNREKFKFKSTNEIPPGAVQPDQIIGMLFQLGSRLKPVT